MKARTEIEAGNQFHSYLRGFRAATQPTTQDKRFTEHEDKRIAAAYSHGYEAGTQARVKAQKYAEKHYGYAPSVLR